jgi:UDP-N-acetylglucosamine--N-acetylmuramyl-(pentapeptide) pyrophosphoryl-undecaprenol N-acetylglucosamine transferase
MVETIVLAAGGTGGHVFPAESVAKALVHKGYKVIFITDKAGRKFDCLPASVQVMVLPMHRRTNSIGGFIKFAWGMIKSMAAVYRGFKIIKPKVVVGFGGYPSFPAVAIAQGMKITTVIHEQNAVLGQVNRILSKRAHSVAVSFQQTERVGDNVQVVVTGDPVRDSFIAARDTTYGVFSDNDPIRMLVTGGSQGASVFSRVVPEAVAALPEALRQRLSILHQAPKHDVELLQQRYRQFVLNAVVVAFIHDMAQEMSGAHLVIARSGASTLAELAMVGRPSLLVPFPHAKDNHQWVNAYTVETVGAGWCVHQSQLTAQTLSVQLELLFSRPETLLEAADKMKKLGMPSATDNVVKLIEGALSR